MVEKYSALQPRNPAGQPDGGRWVSVSGSSGGTNDLPGDDGRRVAANAAGWVNTDYAPRNTLRAGRGAMQHDAADCSGSVWAIYRGAGLPYGYKDTADFAAAAASGEIPFREVSIDQAQPGDVVLYPRVGHMSVYAGDGMVWSAHKPGLPFGQFKLNYFDKIGPIKIYRYQVSDNGRGT